MKSLAIILGKAAVVAGKLLKRGSSLPGDVALKIDRKLLTKMKLPELRIAVTGSSGKGSTQARTESIVRSSSRRTIL